MGCRARVPENQIFALGEVEAERVAQRRNTRRPQAAKVMGRIGKTERRPRAEALVKVKGKQRGQRSCRDGSRGRDLGARITACLLSLHPTAHALAAPAPALGLFGSTADTAWAPTPTPEARPERAGAEAPLGSPPPGREASLADISEAQSDSLEKVPEVTGTLRPQRWPAQNAP